MTRRQAITAIGAGAVAVAAVGAGLYFSAPPPPSGPTTTAATSAPGKISILGFTGALGDPLIPVIDAFKARTGVDVEYVRLGYDELFEKTTTIMKAQSTDFDVVFSDDPFIPKLASEGWLVPLPEMGLSRDPDVFPALYDIATFPSPFWPAPPGFKGKPPTLYAIGFGGGPAVTYGGRTDIISAAGMNIPTTYQEALAVAQKVADPKKPVWGWINRGQKGDPISFDTFPIFWAYGAEMFDQDWKVIINSPEALEALKMLIALDKTGPPELSTYGPTEVALSFVNGQAAQGNIVPGDIIQDVEGAQSKSAGKMVYLPTPSGPKGQRSIIGLFCVGVSTYSKKKDTAVDFIKFWFGREGMRIWVKDGKGLPLRNSFWSDPELTALPHVKPLVEAVPKMLAGKVSPYPKTTEWADIVNIWGSNLNLAITGQLKPEDALSQAASQLTDSLKRAGYYG